MKRGDTYSVGPAKMYVETLRGGTGEFTAHSFFGDSLMRSGDPDAAKKDCCRRLVYDYVGEHPTHEIGIVMQCKNGHRITCRWGTTPMLSGERPLWERL